MTEDAMLVAAMQQSEPMSNVQIGWLIVALVCAITLMYLYLTWME